MRILHTSDWHLGRIFHGIHLTDDQAYVLNQWTGLVKEWQADAVIIAGDIYDRAVPPVEAVKLLDEVLSKIILDYQVPVIMIAGNHDSPERIGFAARLMAQHNLHAKGVFETPFNPIIISDKDGPVYFYAIPYYEQTQTR